MNYAELFGEELGPKVKENMPEGYVLVKEENHVTKESFNSEREKLKNQIEALETQIEERDNQIEQLKNDTQASKELQEKIEELQEKNEQTKQELEQQLQQTKLNADIEKALLKEDARNPKAVKALMNLEKIKEADDVKEEISNQIEDLKENEDYLFGERGLKGKDPEPGEGPVEYDTNPWDNQNINLSKQAEIMRENPGLAKKLIKKAGKDPDKYNL